MALSGSFIHYSSTTSETETDTLVIEYPADLPADDPNYSLRGTTTSESVPRIIETSQSYDDSYIQIQAASIYNIDDNIGGLGKVCSVIWKLFPSESDKTISGSVLSRSDYTFDWDFETMSNPYSEAYTRLKTENGFENLIDV